MNISDNLKKLRKEKDLTQDEISKNLNINRATYAHYETGRREPDAQTLKLFAQYFNVSLDYLMGVTNIRNPFRFENELKTSSKTLNQDLIDLMIRYGIVKDKDSINEKHLEFIKYAIEAYKDEEKK